MNCGDVTITQVPFTGNKYKLFILVVNQLDAQNLLYNKFISCLYMFRARIGVMIPEAV